MRNEKKTPRPNEIACAPLRSLAVLAICGRYAKTRRLLHSVNAASVMSAIVIRRSYVALFRIISWIDERAPAGSSASHLDYHRLLHFDEMDRGRP